MTITSHNGFALLELPLSVHPEDIDRLGHVNNVVYLRWVQEAATAHWRHAATAAQQEEYVWVVMRHEIDYVRPAKLGDSLVARTHVADPVGAKFDRYVEIVRVPDEQLMAKARSIWVAIDPKTGRPRRVTEELVGRFRAAAGG